MKRNWRILLIAVFAVLLLTNAALALDLGVDELTLDPGNIESSPEILDSEEISGTPEVGIDYIVTAGNGTITVKLEGSNYNGYKVELYTSKGKLQNSQIVDTDVYDYIFDITGLTNNAAYTLKVAGYTVDVDDEESRTDYSVTKVVPKASKIGLTLTASGENSVTASLTNYSAEKVKFTLSDNRDGEYNSSYTCNRVPCKIEGLNTDTPIYFRFYPYDADTDSFGTVSAAYMYYLPRVPEEYCGVRSGSNSISVELKNGELFNTKYFDGYKVELYLAGKLKASKTLAVTENTTINFSKLTNNTEYEVRVYGYKTVDKVNYFSYYYARKMMPMAAPTGLSLKINSDNTVTASWPNNEGKQIYVHYRTAADSTYKFYCGVEGSNTCTGKTALDRNTVYYFRFYWYNETYGAYSPYSADTAKMLIENPKAEGDEVRVGYKKMRVYFKDDPSVTGHQIKTYNGDKLVSTVNVKYSTNPTYADITKLTNDVLYLYEVRAYKTVGKTTYYSDPVRVYPYVPRLKPLDTDVPVDVKAAGGAKKITVSWNNEDRWTTGHYIELYRVDNKVMVANAYAANSASSYTFSGSKIDYDVPYMIRVWKYNEKSPKATGNSYVDTYAVSLATPGSFAASAGDKSIKASWTVSGIAQKVNVYWSTSSSGEYTLGCTAPKGQNSCEISGLTNGAPYYVKAEAVYKLTVGDEFSEEKTSAFTAVKTVVPLPASSATVTTDSKIVTVEYDKDSDADGHIIQLYKMSGTKAKLVKTVTNADKTDNVTVTFNKLANGATYRVTICSYKKIGKTTYRGAVMTYDGIVPNASSSASKDLIGVSDLGEAFDGFVDPIDELNAEIEAEEAVETEVKEEKKQPSVFDLFRL